MLLYGRHCISLLVLSFVLGIFFISQIPVGVAASSSKVEYLPGFQHEGPLPFHLETGYIGIGESEDIQLFYYFVKSESNPTIDPIVFWIPGGPGCSSMFALTQEFGPLLFDKQKDMLKMPITLSLNPYSWTKVASFIMLDFPVETGFSYFKTPNHNYSTIVQAGDHGAEFARKWLEDHPEYQSNPFYIGGDSYSGITIPVVALAISLGIEEGLKPAVNFKGYLLGNPVTNTRGDINYMFSNIHGLGAISDEFYELLKTSCKENVYATNCVKTMQEMAKMVSGSMTTNILAPSCPLQGEKNEALRNPNHHSNKKFKWLNVHAIDVASLCYGTTMSRTWANDNIVREALHIQKGTKEIWTQCNNELGKAFKIGIYDTRPYHAKLSTKGYRSLIYSGDHDLLLPSTSTEAWIKWLNYSIINDWRPWLVNGQIAGYTRTFSNNMTYATTKGSGHITPQYTPIESFAMFKRWISYESL